MSIAEQLISVAKEKLNFKAKWKNSNYVGYDGWPRILFYLVGNGHITVEDILNSGYHEIYLDDVLEEVLTLGTTSLSCGW